jgi:hypothetical protein
MNSEGDKTRKVEVSRITLKNAGARPLKEANFP